MFEMSATLIRVLSVGTLSALLPMAAARAAQFSPLANIEPGSRHCPTAAKGVHFIYMVRHGDYVHDSLDTDERATQQLTTLGHEQARLIGERLAGLPVKFDRLISSELLRAAQTADDMGHVMGMAPIRDALLNECAPTSTDPYRLAHENPRKAVACDSARAWAWRRYFVPTPDHDTYDLLVCHAHVIRWTLAKALGADVRSWPHNDAANAALSIFAVFADSSVRLVTYNDTGHIPVRLQTWSGRGGGWLPE